MFLNSRVEQSCAILSTAGGCAAREAEMSREQQSWRRCMGIRIEKEGNTEKQEREAVPVVTGNSRAEV